MSRVLQVSDTHFGTEQPPVMDALAALVREQRPDLLVLSGDITQRARPAQFRAARAFTDRLGLPLLAIPGNHDIPLFDLWTRMRRPYAHYQAAFGDDLQPALCRPDLVVLGVNTTRAWRHKHGEVSSRQIDQVCSRLAQAEPAQLRLVVVHQPVAVPTAADAGNLLRGHAAALQRWAAAGVDLVLGGHIHLPGLLPLPGLGRPVWALQAGTAVSSRVRPGVPNSVNLLHWGETSLPGVCRIEQWDYAAAGRAFLCVQRSDIRPARA